MRRLLTAAAIALCAPLAACGGDESQAAGGASSSPTAEVTDEDRQVIALDACEAKATDQLKAPATAVFPDVDEVEFEIPSTTRVAVTSYVDSENGFGALIRTEWSCAVQLYGDGRLRDVQVTFLES